MLSIDSLDLCLIILLCISSSEASSFNQPKFCPSATWNSTGITFANSSTIGTFPYGIFININNTVYVANQESSLIQVWFENNLIPTTILPGNRSSPYSIFVTITGDIYVDNNNNGVDKWDLNQISNASTLYVGGKCYDLFVDGNNSLYCSLSTNHQVIKRSLNSSNNQSMILAGTTCFGYLGNMLYYPQGIFVDINFDLYVADSYNHRIQLFRSGQSKGTTLVGNGAPETIVLSYPSDVVLDGDGYLFIVDTGNYRIIGSSSNGFRCVAGCFGYSSSSDGLADPMRMAFDSYGNIFVTDYTTYRIQNFLLTANACNATTVLQQTSTPPVNITHIINVSPVQHQYKISYNQPQFCALPTWNPNATTFANTSVVGNNPYGVFIDTNNTIYVISRDLNSIQGWLEGSINPTKNISGNISSPCSFFVTSADDIYVDNGNSYGQVDKWLLNATSSVPAMYITQSCYGLFIDINNTLYCSWRTFNQVAAKSLDDISNTLRIAAGTGCPGSASNMLQSPEGIFVDINFNLYVADSSNARIQLFQPGQLNATTVAGTGASQTITLVYPTSVVLDANGYLFIVDNGYPRIIGSGPNGFRCVVGCSFSGSAPNQLRNPQSMAFDSYGNIYVADTGNSRIQMFTLESDLCETTTMDSQTSTQLEEKQSSINANTESISSTISVATTSSFMSSNQSCFLPIITLIPSTSSLFSPLQFRKSQDFSISSYLYLLNCNNSLSTITKWTISSCTSTCSFQIQMEQTVITSFSELFIPAKTLTYGTYQLTLSVSMVAAPHLSASASAYVKITRSDIIANLIQFGTSMITHGHQQDLILDPGTFSVDPDAIIFNASNWKYKYYCRIYGHQNFPNIGGIPLTIDDPRIDPLNPSCISNGSGNRTALLQYGTLTASPKSSLTILANALASNQTYQFMVYIENLQNSSFQATGYLLVQVTDTQPQLIAIACVISTLCVSNLEYQFVNPTTQLALFSVCIGICTSINNITWNVYQGVINSTSNVVQWTPFNQTNQYQNIWFFGSYTTNFTAANNLFLFNPLIDYWRFEVVYSFPSETSLSAINVKINEPPQNGSCTINPLNGTTSTLFTISCSNWVDQNDIQDYSFYSWTTNPAEWMILAFSSLSTIQLRLPAGNDNIVAHIRDTLDCITEYNLSSVVVVPDSKQITNLVDSLQNSNSQITNNPLIQILASGNQNTVGQIISSLSQEFNKINSQTVENAVTYGIPVSTITVSALNSGTQQTSSTLLNESALAEYNKQLNIYANVRDYLITFATNLVVSTSNSIQLQASSLAQLTQATNQLTRSTSMLASERCYQLAYTLHSMATRIPYENVQTAAIQITQCTSNVLNAINGPLQQRTTVLDLDSSRANAFPQDYDTDLEYEWANPNLFADGNDFSWETIEKGRNIYYQRQIANQIATQSAETMSLLTSALNIHLNIGQHLIMNTSSVFVSLETVSIESLASKLIEQVENTHIQIPSNFELNFTGTASISLRSMVQPLASSDDSRSCSNTNLSRSISLSLFDSNENEISLRTTLDYPIELIIPRDPNVIIPSMTLQNVTALNSTPHYQLFNLHFINITNSLTVSVHFEIHPLNSSLAYLFIFKFDGSPILNSSMNQTDGWTLFCPSNLTNESSYTYFIDNQKTLGHQSVVFGLRELNSTEMSNVCSSSSVIRPPVTNEPFRFISNYELRVYTSGCYYLDTNNNWQSDGLVVGSFTNHYQTQCFSTHLTTFAGGFLVLPAPINWNYVFSNADFARNKTFYITIICVCILYILLMIYARYKDKKDLEKLGVTPLLDNQRSDQYFYQIIVFTGHRKDAGTKSKVHFILAGGDDETQVRTLTDPHRQILQRGGIDAFVMTVSKSLGLLNYIHIWHDNTGQDASASWFLKYIIVRDLQTMEKSYFICQKWLAVEKDNGVIERVLPVAGEYQKREFSYVLSKQAYHSISEGHLWFSIFSRPPSNTFTRAQRCTCCFVLLLTAMLLNILYYDQVAEAKANANTGSSAFGPLFITPEQISIGIIVEILSFLPSILLVQLFRRIQPRRLHQQLSPLRQAIYKIKQQPIPEKAIPSTQKKRSQLMFPWWCIFIAYGLSLIIVGISIFFIIVRGIEFGDLKTQKWLTSLLSGFISSILLIQPVKIIGLAIIFAFFIRDTNKDKEAAEFIDEDHSALNDDEDYLHSIENESPFAYRSHIRVNRLGQTEIDWIRGRRLKEIQMWSILREIFTYVTFLSLLYVITYSNVNHNAFHQVDHLRKLFLNTKQIDNDYTQISTINQYWNWLENSFVENIRAQQWYNGEPPRNLSGFIIDKSNRLIGWPTMRQLRIKSNSCQIQKSVQHLFTHCNDDYSFSNEEKQSFQPGWSNESNQIFNSAIYQAFTYQTSDELDTYIYMGNHETYNSDGYVYEFRGRLSDLRSNISELHQLQWIDSQTRAVIIQFSLYNPNSQLFTLVTLLTEFLSTGGTEPQSRFEPISFQVFTSSQLICAIFYMIFIIYMMVIEIQSFLKLKMNYFRSFWSFINLGIISCSWTSFGIYIWRYRESIHISDLFKETNGFVYVNLQLAVYINDIFTYLLALCCFFGAITFVKFCRFNHRLMLFIKTLQYAGKELFAFACMFSVVFTGFMTLFYLLFVSKLSSCSSLFQTTQMLFQMTLMKFDVYELREAATFLGPFCFSLFIFIVVFVCMSMFMSIINDSFRIVRDNEKLKSNEDQHVLSFILHKFQRWIGLGRSNELERFAERDEQMRSNYFDPVIHFPDKIDQLLDALNRLYMSQQTHSPLKDKKPLSDVLSI